MATMEMVKIDLVCEGGALYAPPGEPVLVMVPPYPFLMIDGTGDPATSAIFQDAIQALYGLAYPLKFAMRKEMGVDYSVMPLEGLWHGAGTQTRLSPHDLATSDREAWRWTLMIRQPVECVEAMFRTTIFVDLVANARRKHPDIPFDRVRMEMLDEGECAQLMYHGPYSEELPAIVRLHEFVSAQGRRPRGPHHEIYLGDPRRAAPGRLRTILRHGVTAARKRYLECAPGARPHIPVDRPGAHRGVRGHRSAVSGLPHRDGLDARPPSQRR